MLKGAIVNMKERVTIENWHRDESIYLQNVGGYDLGNPLEKYVL